MIDPYRQPIHKCKMRETFSMNIVIIVESKFWQNVTNWSFWVEGFILTSENIFHFSFKKVIYK